MYVMQPQVMQQITPQVLSQNMGQIKRRISQTAGETQQMTADVMTQSLEQIMQMCTLLFNQSAAKDKEIITLKENLEKCYSAHPELKISIDAEEKKVQEKSKKGQARKV